MGSFMTLKLCMVYFLTKIIGWHPKFSYVNYLSYCLTIDSDYAIEAASVWNSWNDNVSDHKETRHVNIDFKMIGM